MSAAVLPKVVSMILLGGVSLLVGCLPIVVVKKMGWNSAEDFNSSKKAQEGCQFARIYPEYYP